MTSTSTTSLSRREAARQNRRLRTADLLAQASTATGERRKRLLDDVVVENMPVAKSIASRYRDRGLPLEDLEQVAHAALVRCVHKFDPEAADDLLSYAVPSIRGEVRRYFRDHGWMVRPPRRVQELQSRVVAARDELSGFGDQPSMAAIAAVLEVPQQDVEDALAADGCFRPTSLDMPATADGTVALGELLVSEVDSSPFASVEARTMVAEALAQLPERDRRLIRLRFYDGLTQGQIGDELGVTQTQVSRLLTRVLAALRRCIGELDGETAATVPSARTAPTAA